MVLDSIVFKSINIEFLTWLPAVTTLNASHLHPSCSLLRVP